LKHSYVEEILKQKTTDSESLTGSTIKSGLLDLPSPLAALKIISRAWRKFSALFEPMFPNWIKARVNALKGAGGVTDGILMESYQWQVVYQCEHIRAKVAQSEFREKSADCGRHWRS